jgi:hypothetical protein
MDVFDIVFSTTVDAEREKADIVLDNNRETNEYQIVTTPSGLKVQFGIATETTKDMMKREFLGQAAVPDIFVLPPELFHGGRNFADILCCLAGHILCNKVFYAGFFYRLLWRLWLFFGTAPAAQLPASRA